MDIFKDFGLQFLQLFLNYVVPPLAAGIAALIIAWLKSKIDIAKSRLSADAQWAIEQAVNAAVLAAEQVHLKDAMIVKKDYALDKATEWLTQKGIKFDLAQLDVLIEAAVMEEFNKAKIAG